MSLVSGPQFLFDISKAFEKDPSLLGSKEEEIATTNMTRAIQDCLRDKYPDHFLKTIPCKENNFLLTKDYSRVIGKCVPIPMPEDGSGEISFEARFDRKLGKLVLID